MVYNGTDNLVLANAVEPSLSGSQITVTLGGPGSSVLTPKPINFGASGTIQIYLVFHIDITVDIYMQVRPASYLGT